MRNKILVATAAAFVLSSVAAAPYVASAAPTPGQMRNAGEKKDPAVADAAVSKVEAKDAKKQAHKAHKAAKTARKKAKLAAKKSEKAEKEADKAASR